MNKAIEMIKKQQRGKEAEPEYMIGLQLIDMIREDESISALLEEDLQLKSKSLAACAAELKKEADSIHKEKHVNAVCITPATADRIIRQFYGLPDPKERQAPAQEQKQGDIIELEDLL